MKIDNERDRFLHGFDAGQIVEGTVKLDDATGRYLVVDEDGVGYDVHAVLSRLDGKAIRLTLITMEAVLNMESMLKR